MVSHLTLGPMGQSEHGVSSRLTLNSREVGIGFTEPIVGEAIQLQLQGKMMEQWQRSEAEVDCPVLSRGAPHFWSASERGKSHMFGS